MSIDKLFKTGLVDFVFVVEKNYNIALFNQTKKPFDRRS